MSDCDVHCDCGEVYSYDTHFKCAVCHHIFRRSGTTDHRTDTEEESLSACEQCYTRVMYGEFR